MPDYVKLLSIGLLMVIIADTDWHKLSRFSGKDLICHIALQRLHLGSSSCKAAALALNYGPSPLSCPPIGKFAPLFHKSVKGASCLESTVLGQFRQSL